MAYKSDKEIILEQLEQSKQELPKLPAWYIEEALSKMVDNGTGYDTSDAQTMLNDVELLTSAATTVIKQKGRIGLSLKQDNDGNLDKINYLLMERINDALSGADITPNNAAAYYQLAKLAENGDAALNALGARLNEYIADCIKFYEDKNFPPDAIHSLPAVETIADKYEEVEALLTAALPIPEKSKSGLINKDFLNPFDMDPPYGSVLNLKDLQFTDDTGRVLPATSTRKYKKTITELAFQMAVQRVAGETPEDHSADHLKRVYYDVATEIVATAGIDNSDPNKPKVNAKNLSSTIANQYEEVDQYTARLMQKIYNQDFASKEDKEKANKFVNRLTAQAKDLDKKLAETYGKKYTTARKIIKVLGKTGVNLGKNAAIYGAAGLVPGGTAAVLGYFAYKNVKKAYNSLKDKNMTKGQKLQAVSLGLVSAALSVAGVEASLDQGAELLARSGHDVFAGCEKLINASIKYVTPESVTSFLASFGTLGRVTLIGGISTAPDLFKAGKCQFKLWRLKDKMKKANDAGDTDELSEHLKRYNEIRQERNQALETAATKTGALAAGMTASHAIFSAANDTPDDDAPKDDVKEQPVEEKAEEKVEEKVEEKTEEKVEEKPAEEKTEEKAEEKPAEEKSAEEKTEEKAEEKTDGKSAKFAAQANENEAQPAAEEATSEQASQPAAKEEQAAQPAAKEEQASQPAAKEEQAAQPAAKEEQAAQPAAENAEPKSPEATKNLEAATAEGSGNKANMSIMDEAQGRVQNAISSDNLHMSDAAATLQGVAEHFGANTDAVTYLSLMEPTNVQEVLNIEGLGTNPTSGQLLNYFATHDLTAEQSEALNQLIEKDASYYAHTPAAENVAEDAAQKSPEATKNLEVATAEGSGNKANMSIMDEAQGRVQNAINAGLIQMPDMAATLQGVAEHFGTNTDAVTYLSLTEPTNVQEVLNIEGLGTNPTSGQLLDYFATHDLTAEQSEALNQLIEKDAAYYAHTPAADNSASADGNSTAATNTAADNQAKTGDAATAEKAEKAAEHAKQALAEHSAKDSLKNDSTKVSTAKVDSLTAQNLLNNPAIDHRHSRT